MSELERHAAVVLTIAFSLSLLYEIYRATMKSGTSKHDSVRVLLMQGIPLYASAAIVIALLFAGVAWAPWAGLIYSIVLIVVSIFYYNPYIMVEREPGLIDWFEDLVYTGLLFVAAALLMYEVVGWRLA